jgi:histidine ammonia-lyase
MALSRQRTQHLANRQSGSDTEGVGLMMVLTTATASLMELSSIGTATGHWLPIDTVEDHVPNSVVAAHHALAAVEHGWVVLAAELLAVATVLQRSRRSPTSAAAIWLTELVDEVHGEVRLDVPLSSAIEAFAGVLSSSAAG